MSTGAYNVELQPQTHPWSDSNQTLTVAGERVDVSGATYAPNGNVTAGLIKVRQHGCFPRNFPATVSGKLALIERGECTFGDKVALAGNAGAAGAIIYSQSF